MSSTEAITYSFVNFYYQKLHEDPTQLYQIYTKNAELTHSRIPTDNDNQEIIHKSIETQVLKNKSEIQDFYSSSNLADCKIRVSSIDHQSVESINSILISVIGELALTDESPVYRFTQTFILVPGKTANTFDINNDVFRLIPDDDFELKQDEEEIKEVEAIVEPIKPEEQQNKVESEETENARVNGEVKQQEESQVEEPEVQLEEGPNLNETSAAILETNFLKEESNEETKERVKEEKEDIVSEDVMKIESISQPETKPETKPETENKKESQLKNEDMNNLSPPTKLSWAAQISSAATNAPIPVPSKSKITKPTTSTPPPVAAPKESKESSPKQDLATPPTVQQKPTLQQQQQQRKRFEHLYPVLIRGTDILSAHELRIALDDNFGKTTKVEPRGNFALADFEAEKSQKKALTTKYLKIKDSKITIEPKPKKHEFKDRKPNTNNQNNQNTNANNNNAKKDVQRANSNSNFQKKKNTTKQQ